MLHSHTSCERSLALLRRRAQTPRHRSSFHKQQEINICKKVTSTKYMLMSRYQKAGQKHSINIANRSFDDVAKLKYLGTILTDQNCMHKEIKSSLNSGNGCYYEVQSILSSRLLSKNVKVKLIQKHNSASCFVWV
jgi:hypothetical protein